MGYCVSEMKTELTSKILAGNVLAAARLMRELEDEAPNAVEELKNLYSSTGRAYIVGVTGAYEFIAYGIILVVVLLFLPNGLFSIFGKALPGRRAVANEE